MLQKTTGHEKTRHPAGLFRFRGDRSLSALAGLEAAVGLVDHVNAALAAHDLAVAVPALERAERVANLHRFSPSSRRVAAALENEMPPVLAGGGEIMVGGTGIEPVATTMST